MLRTGRAPRDDAERAVVNNLAAMEFVRAHQDGPLTVEFIRRIHGILALGWLPDSKCGVFRDSDDVVVSDALTGEVLHRPPSSGKLDERIQALCEFANEEPSRFLHPLVRAATLHFMLGYEHPFCDGNGRTARALFHWSMLQAGFRMYEYLPVSRRILTVKSHANSHGVTPQTARSDLVDLESRGLFVSWIDGRTVHWRPVPGLKEKLQRRMPRKRRARKK